ncbi:MAG: phage tail protein [Acidobacteriota bacterium]
MIIGDPSVQPPFGQHQVLPVPLPVGAVIPYAGPADDAVWKELETLGWLPCDGREVPQVAYPLLFQLIGDIYGDASEDNFLLPDYRGAFLRGVNGTRQPALDPDADHRVGSGPGGSGNGGNQVGSLQEDQFQEHEHRYVPNIQTSGFSTGETPAVISVNTTVTQGVECRDGTPGSPDCFGPETRPVNLYIHFLIKAVPDQVVLNVPAAAGGPIIPGR